MGGWRNPNPERAKGRAKLGVKVLGTWPSDCSFSLTLRLPDNDDGGGGGGVSQERYYTAARGVEANKGEGVAWV